LGNCRGFNSWDEEAAHYHSLTPEQQRHWRIEGHAYMVSLQPKNRDKSPEENWLQAETETQREEDLHRLWGEKSAATNREEKALKAAIFYLVYGTKVPADTVSTTTPLPQDERERQLLCKNVADELIAEPLTLPVTVRTVGELVAFIIANFRRR